MQTETAATRVKHNSVLDKLRDEVVAGCFASGSQFPTRLELQERFGASIATIQRAVNRLTEEGFVTVRGRQGTFVAEHPPHTSTYALVNLEPAFLLPEAFRFWDTLAKVAHGLDSPSGHRVRLYERVLLHTDDPGYRQLADDVTLRRVAGVIYVGKVDINGSPLLELNHCPRVGIGCTPLFGKLPSLDHDWYQLFDRALDYFLNRGRRRIAVVSAIGHPEVYYDYILAGAASRGLSLKPHWLQVIHVLTGDWTSRLVHLLLHAEQSERPDALFVENDNFLLPAVKGIQAAGCRVPEDLDVLSHWNFPAPLESPLPIRRLGFDARQSLRICMQLLDAQRRGETPPMMTKIPAVFENEISAGGPP